MCTAYTSFFLDTNYSFLLISPFFFLIFIISGARLDGVTNGEGEEEGSADVAINFMLMKISLWNREIRKSEKLLWQVAKWVTKVSVKFGLQLNTQKEVAAAVGKAELQWAEEQQREKLSLQKWFSSWNTKGRSGGNVNSARNIQLLQNWAFHCCFLPNHRRDVLFQWKDDTGSLSVMSKHGVPALKFPFSCREFLYFLIHIFLIFWIFSFITAEEKQSREAATKRNACEREYRRGELVLASLVLVLLAFMKDKMFFKIIFLKLTRHEQLKELTVLGCTHIPIAGTAWPCTPPSASVSPSVTELHCYWLPGMPHCLSTYSWKIQLQELSVIISSWAVSGRWWGESADSVMKSQFSSSRC